MGAGPRAHKDGRTFFGQVRHAADVNMPLQLGSSGLMARWAALGRPTAVAQLVPSTATIGDLERRVAEVSVASRQGGFITALLSRPLVRR